MERWGGFGGEVKHVSVIAAPMVVVAVSQYLMQMVVVVMVGHVDQLSLSSVAIATSITNITGFSLLSGLVGGLDTLCGQAVGAKQYNKLGIYTCSAIISLLLLCIPVSISWIFLDKFLILIGQDPLISHEARKYAIYLIPALFGGAVVKPLVRSLQSQSLMLSLLVSCTLALCLHVPLCWAFVFRLKMGSVGAAVAFSLSNWFYLVLIVSYVKFSSKCENTSVTISLDSLICVKEFFRFAIPSAIMVWSVYSSVSPLCEVGILSQWPCESQVGADISVKSHQSNSAVSGANGRFIFRMSFMWIMMQFMPKEKPRLEGNHAIDFIECHIVSMVPDIGYGFGSFRGKSQFRGFEGKSNTYDFYVFTKKARRQEEAEAPEYSRSNDKLVKDTYLRRYMDEQGWVPANVIAGSNKFTTMEEKWWSKDPFAECNIDAVTLSTLEDGNNGCCDFDVLHVIQLYFYFNVWFLG
ncbi:hypothetical protein SSX86_001794 [Deinandra increscens subsp. villosa]|uniref:Protein DETOXIFICATION n=1 Tax=Deinandra increscens subsp. villosa TaxID=3103831 RepID=A0AAP0DSB7_9ASTR